MIRRLAAALALAVCALSAPAAADMRVALVIGNSAYEAAGALRNPANDAADASAALKRLGFQVATVMDADGRKMSDALAKFAEDVEGADIALFWYAGHGIQFENVNYFLPVDARLDNQFAFRREAFAFDDIIRSMESAAKVSLIFIDACRDTPLSDKLKASLRVQDRNVKTSRGLARVENQSPDTLLVYATAPGQVAQDGDGRNSPFAAAMLKHMETPDVDVEVMLKDVTSDVRRATREKQKPERLSRLESKVILKSSAPPQPGDVAERSRQDAERAEKEKLDAAVRAVEADQVKRQAEADARAADEAKRRVEAAARTLWDHNGSTVYLVTDGANRRFHYQSPRAGIAARGVKPGALLFRGAKDGESYSGFAYVFSQSCGAMSYKVRGAVAEGGRRVTLYGDAPKVNEACQTVGYKEDVLVFTYISAE